MKVLVLSGGGSKGSYQVGVLNKWILDEGCEYDAFIGTSVGAINATHLAQAAPGKLKERYQGLREMWWDLENDKIYDKWFLGEVAALWKPSMYCAAPLRQLIIDHLNYEMLAKSGRKLRVVAVSWKTGQVVIANEATPDLEKWVYASASMPVFFDPIEIEGELYTDGGLREIAPIGEAIKLGADEIDVIITSDPRAIDNWDTKDKHTLSYVLRVADIMSTEVLLNDIKVCELKNRLADYGEDYKKVKVRLMIPSQVVGDSMDFSSTKMREMIALGYKDAQRT
jgi:NTE family protein